MDGDTGCAKVEDAVGCHVEDAVTFWAQSVSRCDDLLKLSCELAEACPRANAVFGKPDFNKIYGGCFSEDRCWYRCMVRQVINSEKCQVLYIDYRNSEVLSRSDIVEIPPNLQCPSVAQKYRLWGLQVPTDQDLNMFEQGKKFLSSLVSKKETKIHQKAKHDDGTIIAQAEYEKIDIGEEVAKAGFAEKHTSPGNTKDAEERRVDVVQNHHQKIKEERMLASTSVLDTSLAQVRPDQKLSEEKEVLKRENVNLLQRQKELELQVQQLKCELQKEKELSKKAAESFEETLCTYIGMKIRSLAANVKALKEVSQTNKYSNFAEQPSQAIKVVTEGCLTVPCSLEKLQKIWAKYDLTQEQLWLCGNVDERDELITKRDEVQQNLYSAVEEIILEVDQLSLSERSRTLQAVAFEPGFSLAMPFSISVYPVVLKSSCSKKEVFDLMSEASSDLEEMAGSADEILKKVELAICEELNTDLYEHDEAGRGIIMSAYNKVMYNIHQEQSIITVVQNRYLASVEFKKQSEKWLNRRPDINNLLIIKKTVKSLKAQLRWKLVEKNNFEESHDYSEFEMLGIKEEIADLQNRVLQEISKEREEYEQRAAANTMVVGTLSLVSPELKMGQPASPASDTYAYGCLLFWLCTQNQEFGVKEDTPEVDAVVMDDKVKSLLLNFFCCNRLTAEQVLRDNCFLVVDAIPVSPQPGEEHEPHEEHDSEKMNEKKEVFNCGEWSKPSINEELLHQVFD
ncbi:LOW QUALITY PROTEIN: serine/threonine-protein kinase 31 [Pterocles gutturalis]